MEDEILLEAPPERKAMGRRGVGSGDEGKREKGRQTGKQTDFRHWVKKSASWSTAAPSKPAFPGRVLRSGLNRALPGPRRPPVDRLAG